MLKPLKKRTSALSATFYSYFDSPIGRIFVQGDGRFLTGLFMPNHKGWGGPDATWCHSDQPFAEVREQLTEYFTGQRQSFDLPLKPEGTQFQRRVWQELVQIPFGTTISYAQLAERVGNSSASRAVGSANGRNPISIVVPCHRVIGASGQLTGYGGGLERKQWLIDWEGQVLCKAQANSAAARLQQQW